MKDFKERLVQYHYSGIIVMQNLPKGDKCKVYEVYGANFAISHFCTEL